MTNATETLTSGPAVVERPESVQPETASQPEAVSKTDSPDLQASAQDTGGAASDDFATALENFTTESEEAAGEDNVIHGTVVKLSDSGVTVKVAEQVRLEFDRSAIGRIVPAQGEGGSTS